MRFVDRIQAFDVAIFRGINRGWSSAVLDPVMAFLSGNRLFAPALVLLVAGLLWKGGRRGRVFVVVVGLAAALANEFLVEPLKDTVRRPRPYTVLEDARLRVGRGNPVGSFPSAHALNTALIAAVAGWYYRRSLWIGVPIAAGVALSRVYNGVHYPSDILTGAALGAGFGLGWIRAADGLWRWLAPRVAPRWAVRLPSLRNPDQDLRTPARSGETRDGGPSAPSAPAPPA